MNPTSRKKNSIKLLTGVQAIFPMANLTAFDIQAVYASIRPVTDVHTEDPSKASQEQALWCESGWD